LWDVNHKSAPEILWLFLCSSEASRSQNLQFLHWDVVKTASAAKPFGRLIDRRVILQGKAVRLQQLVGPQSRAVLGLEAKNIVSLAPIILPGAVDAAAHAEKDSIREPFLRGIPGSNFSNEYESLY
jgi:hypothetical protein